MGSEMCIRDRQEMGILMGPMGPMEIPWEWHYVPCANGIGNGNGNELMGMGGNGNNCFSKIFPYSCMTHIALPHYARRYGAFD